MEKTLQRLGEVDIIPPPGPSKFVAPQTVMYHLDGDPPPSHSPGSSAHAPRSRVLCRLSLSSQDA